MSVNEIILLAALAYAVIGVLCLLFAAVAEMDWRGLLFAFFCWPVFAFYGLLMLIDRLKSSA